MGHVHGLRVSGGRHEPLGGSAPTHPQNPLCMPGSPSTHGVVVVQDLQSRIKPISRVGLRAPSMPKPSVAAFPHPWGGGGKEAARTRPARDGSSPPHHPERNRPARSIGFPAGSGCSTRVDHSTISYLRVKNKLRPKEFHTQHPTKLGPSKNHLGPGLGPSAPALGFGGGRSSPGRGGWWGGTGLVLSCSPGRPLPVFRVLEESGAAGSGCPGAGELPLLLSVEAEALRPKGRQAGSARLPRHRGFGSAQPAQASQNHAKIRRSAGKLAGGRRAAFGCWLLSLRASHSQTFP